jgi:predicted nuclease with TOPRIM domain
MSDEERKLESRVHTLYQEVTELKRRLEHIKNFAESIKEPVIKDIIKQEIKSYEERSKV